MDCIVHKVAKSRTRLSDFHSLRHQLPLQSSLVFTGKEYTSKSGKNLLVKNESGLFPSSYSLRPLFLKVSLSKFPLKYLEKNWKLELLSRVRLFTTPWTIQSMEFSRLEYWTGMPFPSPGYLPNPGIEPSLPHCRWIIYHLSHQGSPRILEWVANTFSSRSSQPRNRTRVPCIAGRFFTRFLEGSPRYYFKQYVLRLFN